MYTSVKLALFEDCPKHWQNMLLHLYYNEKIELVRGSMPDQYINQELEKFDAKFNNKTNHIEFETEQGYIHYLLMWS